MIRVYVSATYQDLHACRAEVQEALRKLKVECVAMESYVAQAPPPLEKCLRDVESCDLYVGIFAWRYGFVPAGYSQSITELEYRRARATGKECLIFLLDEDAAWPRRQVDRGIAAERIDALRAELAADHLCGTFTNAHDLTAGVTAAVAAWLVGRGSPRADPPVLEAADLRTYYNRLCRRYGGLDLDTLTPPRRKEYLRITLMSVFVEQSVREDPPPTEVPREWLSRFGDHAAISERDLPEGVDPAELTELRDLYLVKPLKRLMDVVTAADRPRVALLGDPGSGKSTVARYLALFLAGAHTDNRLAPLVGQLPLLIELRSYAAVTAEGRCRGFLSYLDCQANDGQLGLEEAHLRSYLSRAAPALAIFDGLDEVFDQRQREAILHQIADFAAEFPQARVIVTARGVGYNRHILSMAGFAHYTIQDLDEHQIEEFVNRWCRSAVPQGRVVPAVPGRTAVAAAPGTTSLPDTTTVPGATTGYPAAAEPQLPAQPGAAADAGADAEARAQIRGEAERYRGRLLDALRQSTAMRELAGNPMLLTVLAIVGRHQSLPRHRWKLYDHAANILAAQWDLNRLGVQRPGLDFIDAEDKKELLRRLAYRMQSNPRALAVNCVQADEFSQLLEDYLRDRYGRDQSDARAIARQMLDQFRERDFIISCYGDKLYGFVHRAFLEFFCADAIVRKFTHHQRWRLGNVKELFRAHWAEPSWREILRLVAGALHERHTAQLITLLTAQNAERWPAREFAEPPWNLALATQCLADVRNLFSTVAEPAEVLLRRLILLLEHCVGGDDRDTEALIEDEILPAARIIGSRWPGRESYLAWYRRRGSRVLSGSVMSSAARLAALLSEPADGIAELFDEVLSDAAGSHAAYAAVAGLAELAGRAEPAAAAESAPRPVPAERLTLADVARRARDLLARRARGDTFAGVRLAAVLALAERFSPQREICDLMIQLSRADGYPRVRLATVRALGERYCDEPDVCAVLVERAGRDDHASVRQAAIELIGERFPAREELREMLARRLRADQDAAVVATTARVLAERYHQRELAQRVLIERLRDDPSARMRRAAVSALGEYLSGDQRVREQFAATIHTDHDAVVLRLAARALATHERATGETRARKLLIERAEHRDELIRRAVIQVLAECFPDDREAVAVHIGRVRDDRDATVRLAAVRTLVPLIATDAEARRALAGWALADRDATVRLTAVEALAGQRTVTPQLANRLAEMAERDGDPGVRLAVVARLATLFDPDTARRVAVRRCREDLNPRVRLAALDALARYVAGFPDARAATIERLNDDSSGEVVTRATTALLDAGRPSDEVRSTLLRRSGRDNPAVRLAGVRLLAHRWPDSPDVPPALLERLREDPDPEVMRAAAAGLAKVRGAPRTDELGHSDPPPRTDGPRRPRGLDGKRPDEEGPRGKRPDEEGPPHDKRLDGERLEVVLRRATDAQATVRAAAMWVLGEYHSGEPRAQRALISAASNDHDVEVRRTALRMLDRHLGEHPTVRSLLIDLLDDPDWSIWESVVRVLAERHGTDPRVRAALVHFAGRADDPQMRRVAGQALTSLPGADPDLLPDVPAG